jgi:hypothetical protein
VAKLNADLTRILNTAEMKEFLAKQRHRGALRHAQSASEKARWAKVVKEAGIKAD